MIDGTRWLDWFNTNMERLDLADRDLSALSTMAFYADAYCDIRDALGITPVSNKPLDSWGKTP